VVADRQLSPDLVASERDPKHMPGLMLGNNAYAGRASNGASGTKSHEPKQGSGLQYLIPASYRELLDRVGSRQGNGVTATADSARAGETDDSEKLDTHSREAEGTETFSFWAAVRKLARRRLESKEPDIEPWEHRVSRFHESLWIEELRVELEMAKWRLTVDWIPMVGDDLYKLDISELSDDASAPLDEKGFLRGVHVNIKCSGGSVYRAMIQPGSAAGSLLLSSSPSLARAQGPFQIRFHPHRFQELAMHRALDAPRNGSFLRAAHDEAAPLSRPDAVDEAADTLPASLNDDQRRAVAAVLATTSDRPLVVWGPPGTGKSTLAAFVIWHLVQQGPSNLNILAAAPSNTGADVLCRKLGKLGLDPARVLRLNAVGRSVATVPEDIRQFCFTTIGENGRPTFRVPPLSKLRTFKVIVTTCVASVHLANALRVEGSTGWFSHVIVDEAGEATEPETLVPLSLLRRDAGTCVLFGDHFQLGPLVMSRLASQLASLEISMIERLANERFTSVRDGEDRGLSRDTLLTCEDNGLHFLTESYRSHSAITALYSQIFYAGQLEHRERSQQLLALPFFADLGFTAPVILHNVIGQERRDSDSPSVCNDDEVKLVTEYVVQLLADDRMGLRASDIGVITPYTKQLQVLQTKLGSLGPTLAGVECGTVEWFQGQERTVVIMSTVRCSRLADGSVVKGGADRRPIGFVADPKRLNVAISRAVAGLIIVGDLRMLASNSSHWRQLLDMAKDLGCVTGEPLVEGPWQPESPPKAAALGLATVRTAVPVAQASAAWDALTSS